MKRNNLKGRDLPRTDISPCLYACYFLLLLIRFCEQFKMPLRMNTRRTFFGRFFSFMDITAVSALP
jgi:hypothetical protein